MEEEVLEKDILKDIKRKKIVSIILTIVSISLIIGSFSYAWLNGVFTSNNTVNITAGNLNLSYNASDNLISLTNELPKLDTTALANNSAHTFTLTNDGTENIGYIIRLENICVTGVDIDACVPNAYMKTAIKVGDGSYTTSSLNYSDIIARGNISAGETISFSLKIWLNSTTPNVYNPGTTTDTIMYKGKIVLTATQQLGTLVSSITTTLSNTSVNVGSQIQASATVSPSDARDQSYTWSSSDSSIATIASDGTVSGISAGTAYICVTANDGGNAYDCKLLTVVDPS
ncbi:MAG TPA: Ig-like domain-containing protein [Bacilli bacterium]|nr:Ig-like domain-containing protein [Bacilli bacterium]